MPRDPSGSEFVINLNTAIRPQLPAWAARHRRRGDRIGCVYAAHQMLGGILAHNRSGGVNNEADKYDL